MREDKYYHSRLLELSKVFDGPIEVIKRSFVDEQYSSWIVWLLNSPIRDISKFKSINEGLYSFFTTNKVLALFPFISGAIGPSVLYFSQLGPTLSVCISFILGYLFTMIFYFPMLLTFNSGHFHTGAYRTFRKQEYELFKLAFLDEKRDFYFKGLYDYISIMILGNQDVDRVYNLVDKRLDSYIHFEKQHLESQKGILEDRLKQKEVTFDKMKAEYDDFIDQLVFERDEVLLGSEYVIELIKDINKVLFRMKNNLFSMKDLNLISGFTLYEKRGDILYCLEDVGTTGATPKHISIKSSVYKLWGVVIVINENLKQPLVNHPYENHVIVSFQMKMDYNKVWVYNFHFDQDDKKAWSLLVKNDIIESREVYRLIHALCLLSQESVKEEKEAAQR